MKPRPRILITNDDGIAAPGIKHLWSAISDFADVVIVAPAHEQSAVSLSITIRDPLRLEKVIWEDGASAWMVNGTPADCVKLALSVVMKDAPPDLILSGINRGSNSGRNVLYSGTIAGVVEGVMHQIPGIAFSCRDIQNPEYLLAQKYIPKVLDYVLQHPLPEGTFLNVNFPHLDGQELKGFKMVRQGREFWTESPDCRSHPAGGHTYYWLGAKLATFDEDDSDVLWLKCGYMTAVPIHIAELTDHKHLQAHKTRFEDFFTSANIIKEDILSPVQ